MSRILIVEDEIIIGMMLAELIREEGHEPVGPFASATGARSHLNDIDAAVLDILVEDGPVFPLAREIRDRGIPFFFASGSGCIDMEEFDDTRVLGKPYREDALKERLRELKIAA